jgi:hypothetical protein
VRRGLVDPLLVLLLVLGACGGGGEASDDRGAQVRDAAEAAGLPDDVVDVLALAARGAGGTFQVTYPGEDGTSVVISQAPPDRRVDVIAGERILQSHVVRGGVAYRCAPPEDDPRGELVCRRSQSAIDAPGTFTDEALHTFTEELAASRDDLELSVEERTIAGVDVTCLVAAPAAGRRDERDTDVESICVSDEGAQLLVDAAGERLEASAYATDVPEGTFDTAAGSRH